MHGLIGRKQTPEQIQKRVEATAKKKSLWTKEQRDAFSEKIRRVNDSRNPEIKNKFIYSNIGREPWCKGKKIPQISGENHWNWGKTMSEDSIEKMRKTITGRKQSPETIKKRFDSRAGYRHSSEVRAKIGMANSGENNGQWKGGISKEPYPITWSFRLREAIRNRDGRKCRACGKDETSRKHDVHHIDYNKENINQENLVSLCHNCHGKTNYNREQWTEFFLDQNKEQIFVSV